LSQTVRACQRKKRGWLKLSAYPAETRRRTATLFPLPRSGPAFHPTVKALERLAAHSDIFPAHLRDDCVLQPSDTEQAPARRKIQSGRTTQTQWPLPFRSSRAWLQHLLSQIQRIVAR